MFYLILRGNFTNQKTMRRGQNEMGVQTILKGVRSLDNGTQAKMACLVPPRVRV